MNNSKTAVILLDFINDIVHPKGKVAGSAAFVEEHHVIENANKLIAFANKHMLPIVLVKVGFSENYAECPVASPLFSRAKEFNAIKLNTWGTEFHEKLNVKPQDFIVIKHRVSAFYATDLETFLRANDIRNLILAGVSTDMAVQSTARDAHDRDYKVIVVADACGAASAEFHESALKLTQRIATIITTADLQDAILQ